MLRENERYNITMDALITSMQPIMPFLQDKEVFEVYINPNGKIWTDGLAKGRDFTGEYISPEATRAIILGVAALTDQLIKQERPV